MTETSDLTDIPFQCRYCHVTGYMHVLGEVSDSFYLRDEDPSSPIIWRVWSVIKCINCERINVTFEAGNDHNEILSIVEIIYPESITYKASPKVDLVFRAAIKTIPINPASAVNQFRVIIEMIWHEHCSKGEQKHKLRGDQGIIKQLKEEHILSGKYLDMVDVLANIGDKGSHYDEKSISREDAEIARDLCAVILQHVYENRREGMKLAKKLEKKFPRENGWHNGQYYDRNEWPNK